MDCVIADCKDAMDCSTYSSESCVGVFKTWAIKNCPRTCGYCTGKQETIYTLLCHHRPLYWSLYVLNLMWRPNIIMCEIKINAL